MSPAAALQLLGLTDQHGEDQVHAAFRRLSKLCHPDAGGTAEQFCRLKMAQEVALEYLKQLQEPDIVMEAVAFVVVPDGFFRRR